MRDGGDHLPGERHAFSLDEMAFDDALPRDIANDVYESRRAAFRVGHAADAQVERTVTRAVERLDLNHVFVFRHLRVGTALAFVKHRVTGVSD
jgi:hypothetical protein